MFVKFVIHYLHYSYARACIMRARYGLPDLCGEDEREWKRRMGLMEVENHGHHGITDANGSNTF